MRGKDNSKDNGRIQDIGVYNISLYKKGEFYYLFQIFLLFFLPLCLCASVV